MYLKLQSSLAIEKKRKRKRKREVNHEGPLMGLVEWGIPSHEKKKEREKNFAWLDFTRAECFPFSSLRSTRKNNIYIYIYN